MLFTIHALDRPDSADLRQTTRPAHLDYLADFDIVAGGPLKNDRGEMCGSVIFVEAESLAAATEFAAGDPYRKAGLFESVSIHEFQKVVWPS